ncbi:hypothetical protein Tco_0321848 [Tanacetum coccineum]
MQAGRGEGFSAAQDDEYEYISDTDSDATLSSPWSNVDDKNNEAKDSDMDIDDEDSDKRYDSAAGFGTTFVVANPEGNPEVTSFLSGASEVPFGTNVDVQATEFVLQELLEDVMCCRVGSIY